MTETTKRYKVNEIYHSVQGEGKRAGQASIFLRFTGCNMRCAMEPGDKSPGGFDCDTEFESGIRMSASQIVERCIEESGGRSTKWIVATGGEPALQLDEVLIDALHSAGFRIQIETNGSIQVSDKIDFITVSPKVAEHCIRQTKATEVKYVRGYGQALPKTRVEAGHYLISPAFNGASPDKRTIEWCQQLVAGTEWEISVQLHKIEGIR